MGGKLGPASVPPGKALLAAAQTWYERTLKNCGVCVKTGVHATAEMLRAEGAELVFVAAGSRPICPDILKETASRKDSRIRHAVDVLNGAPVGRRVLILGGGLVGCECAAFLASGNHDVTIVELRDALAPDMEKHGRFFLLEELKSQHVTVMTGPSLAELSDDGRARVKDAYGNLFDLPAFDTVVPAVGYSPDQELCAQLSRAGIPFTAAGDCTKTGKIFDAVHAAHAAALNI